MYSRLYIETSGIMEVGTPLPGYASGVPGYASAPGSASAAASPVATAVPPTPVAKATACPVRAPATAEREMMISILVLLCGERWRGEEHHPEQC